MSRFQIVVSLLFILFLQIFVCNNINLFGFVNPYIYVSFVFLFPLSKNRFLALSSAFIYGIILDFFSDTGAVHAFALVFVTYIRIFFLKLYFRKSDLDFLLFRLSKESFGKVFNYVITLTFIHHLIMFLLANFNFSDMVGVLTNSLYATLFTTLLYFLGSFLFNKRMVSS